MGRSMIATEEAKEKLLKCGLRVVDDFVHKGSYSVPDGDWIECEHKNSALYNNIVYNGSRCRECLKTSTEEAKEKLLKCGLRVVDDFVHKGKYSVPDGDWIECEHKNSALYNNIVNNGSRCRECFLGGYNANHAGTFYIIVNYEKQWIKIGITNNFEQRFKKHESAWGASPLIEQKYEDGRIPMKIEGHMKKIFRDAGYFPTMRDLGETFDGMTETYELTLFTYDIVSLIEAAFGCDLADITA